MVGAWQTGFRFPAGCSQTDAAAKHIPQSSLIAFEFIGPASFVKKWKQFFVSLIFSGKHTQRLLGAKLLANFIQIDPVSKEIYAKTSKDIITIIISYNEMSFDEKSCVIWASLSLQVFFFARKLLLHLLDGYCGDRHVTLGSSQHLVSEE